MNWNDLISNSFWHDNHRILFNKDCRAMFDLPDESIQCIVTSPPYWGLRKYSGNQDLIWGGKEDCQHQWDIEKGKIDFAIQGKQSKTFHGGLGYSRPAEHWQRGFCSLCGAWRGAYGLEPTPEMYVQHTIEILREIRRVLRKDGVVFWNIGDSYYGGGFGHEKDLSAEDFAKKYPKQGSNRGTDMDWQERKQVGDTKRGKHSVLKPKDLCLIPFRVAIAAQEDGWWVRSVIIWNKPNPMPESVTDRPTESHEYILMLTKSAKYYWDATAVREGQPLLTTTARATDWASLSGATVRIECSATLNADNLPSNLRGRHSFHSLEPAVNFTVAFYANKLEIGGMISGNAILEYPEGQTVMNLKDAIISRGTTDFALITPLSPDKPSNDMPVLSSIIDASPTPHTIFLTNQLTDHPLGTTHPTTKVVAWLHILEITPELFTTEITFDKSVAGSPFLIRCSFVSSHLNNIIPQRIRGLKTKDNQEVSGQEQHHGQDIFPQSGGRNLRSVWTFPTQPYRGAHFATYPEKLVEICIKAATPEVGCCSKCGKPWTRVIEKGLTAHDGKTQGKSDPGDKLNGATGRLAQLRQAARERGSEYVNETKTLGWQPQCKCNAAQVPSIVLDPFAGSGTTLLVASKLGRYSIAYELSKDYCSLIVNRNKQSVLL